MTEDCMGQWHYIYFDSLFMLTTLMKLLLDRKSYACGRAHAGRKKWPKQLKLKCGKSRMLQHKDLTMVMWHYNWDVLLVSTNSDPITDDKTVIESGRGREQVKIPCPKAVVDCIQNTGSPDILDQKREYYGVDWPSKNARNIFFTFW
jgi:hypothetical protein